MALINVEWTKTQEPIWINKIADELGFNLRTLKVEGIAEDKWDWIDKKIRTRILLDLDRCWEEDGRRKNALAEVKQGVYVITLAGNLSIDYEGGPSKVLYIGRGQLRSRLNSHFKEWIRYLSDSLQDIALEIWMTEIKVPGSKNAFKEVESDLIRSFWDDYKEFPLQNRQHGDLNEKNHDYEKKTDKEKWNTPLHKPTNIQHGWSVKPLSQNPWHRELAEE